nr:PREDICTED: flagellar attachment zone protein 1 isoform X2 [Megachile rotundata]
MADGGGIKFENHRNITNVKIDDTILVEEYSSLVRKPENGTISQNILSFFHSYGYNCRKYFNLCRIDINNVAFAAGNLIQIFNIVENKIWFKKASLGQGIGHLSRNPVHDHIAVALNGINPLIIIYSWPSMKTAITLEGGTTKCYSYMTYSQDGILLASQGGEPDYYVSIWKWQESQIILQCKSYVQDIYKITFSKYIPGHLTSGGIGHIKFWKISKTFTGLKLKGEIGKFGNTEISDIIAIHPMPNETVISGCEWGNILLWDESLIKLEARRKSKETAHAGPITQFEFINGEIISVGTDGWIRFWFYETMDHANLSDEERFLEIQPIYEFEIASGEENAMLMCIHKQESNNPDATTWYAQEATLLVGCLKGHCVEIQLHTIPQLYTTTTYELHCNSMAFKFESVKSSIHREIVRKEYEQRREKKIEEKRKEMEQLMRENPHIVIDEEAFLMEIEEEEMILPELYIPEIPNRVLVAEYGINGNIWLFMAGFDAGYVYEYPRPLCVKIKQNKPSISRIIENAMDTEIHKFLYYKNKEYLILATQYGELYICKINKEDPLDFSDYWILPVHDYYNGLMSKISFGYDKKMLLTCGHDGNIFSFIINDDISDESIEIPIPEQPTHLPKSIEDIEDAEHPSLEQVITQKEQNRILSLAEKKKKEILQIIRDLSEEYVAITIRNKNLLPSQQIVQFELDPRITEDLRQHLKANITLTIAKLEFQVEKSKLQLQKLMNHFVMPITCLPFAVCSILNEDKKVHSLRELKLNIENILRCFEKMKQDEKEQRTGRLTQEEIEMEKYESQEEELQDIEILLAEDYSDLSSGLGLQIKQILTKYKEIKRKLMERQKEWKKLYAKKPDLAKSSLEDAAFLEKAKETIGEFNLKTDTGFNLKKKKETAVEKYKQLLDCRRKLHHLRDDFNTRLKNARSQKQKLQKEVTALSETLKKIHMELPPKSIKPLPHPPKINFNIEFPELNLELERYMSMSEKMEQVKQQRQSIADHSMDPFDLEHEVLYCGSKKMFVEETESLTTLLSSSKLKIKDHSSTHMDLIYHLSTTESTQTTWEREMKRSRMWRKLYEQDCILRSINISYKELEDELAELEEYRLDVIYQSIYMNLHLLTLYEEFIILKECEETEYALEKKVEERSNEFSTIKLQIQTTNVNIAAKEEEIRKLHLKIKDITVEFAKTIIENKFQDFLHKIFRKKYTPVKERDGSSDTFTQSSETSSEESDDTIDSETEHIPLDESICPPGCDKELYENAFFMRERRYECEFQIKEKQKDIEILQKELDSYNKNLRFVENNLKSSKQELEDFMLKKQKRLNNIDVTVVLKLHQLQHISPSGDIEEIQNCVLFNKTELSNLYNRIGELQEETHSLEEKRKENEAHLKRIKLDLKYMKTENKRLKEEIKEKMIQKFGQQVSLVNLYETILQRLIYDTKTDVRKMMKTFNKEMKSIKLNCNKASMVLECLIRDNTEKLSLLTVLEKENIKLGRNLDHTLIPEENMLQIELDYKTDITKLENILYNQMQQKYLLQRDIENLKTGSKKLPSLCLKDSKI